MNSRIKLVILGGSALSTPLLFESMAQRKAAAPYDVVLLGRDRERLDFVKRVSRDLLQQYPEVEISIQTSTDAEKAMEGADYCINQIRVGGLQGRAFDESFPRQFGIPGEETVGPGGFNRALQSVPVVLKLCRSLEKLAPNVVMLNLTNPSSLIQYAIRRYTGVNVVGTCDAPITLMEMIARALDVSSDELEFNIAGMHHFTWIVGVRQDDKELMSTVMDRLDKMPKLGVDPEIVRALGAIPSSYFKYYFHPDRVLAATEGRKLRGSQLIQIKDQMLEDLRCWKPGEKPEMIYRRGAIWYDTIVAPTLLALAEKRTEELVLSVDNNGSIPYLPDNAIIEAPVTLSNGEVISIRAAELPPDVKGLLQSNCAYEMLAVEAVVEKDRGKAMRALMSNLMVSNFNQAHGVVDLVWPPEKTDAVNIAFPESRELRQGLKVPELFYGNTLLETTATPEQEIALITMEEPWELARDRFARSPKAIVFVRDLDWYALEAMERGIPDVGAVVGLGGGTPTDAAKYLAWRRGIPVDIFPSITSVDAAVTKSIAARSGKNVTYIGHIVPRNVFVDFRLIMDAPPRLNRSGIGDIVSAYVALWDWKLARERKAEPYDLEAVKATQAWLDKLEKVAESIDEVTPDGIRFIMEAFEDISVICRVFGSSRPQEASEHTFAYNAEFQTGKSFLHGELVALGTFIMASLQGNDPDWLLDIYQRTGLLWQPRDIDLTRDDFVKTMATLNWYQNNYGRRFSILDEKLINRDFIEQMMDKLKFE